MTPNYVTDEDEDDEDNMPSHVTVKRFCELSGYSPDKVHSRILRGDWREGTHWVLAPDGDVLIDTDAKDMVIGKPPPGYVSVIKTEMFLRRTAIPLAQMPEGSGVYFLWQDDALQYVGQSIGLMRRIGEHMFQGIIKFNRLSWLQCAPEEMTRLENAYIYLLQPAMNIRGARK